MDTDDGREREAEAGNAAPVALSRPARWIVALGALAVALAAGTHLLIMFLHVAPPNTVSKQHAATIGDYVLPEYEQNWKFFAPNPLQQNIAVQVRAQVTRPDGEVQVTPWTDLSAQDGAAILHNPLPSHAQQNQLRRAWDFYGNTHDDRGRSTGLRGDLAEDYLRRLAVSRLNLDRDGTRLHRVQLRSVTTSVAPPAWAGQQPPAKPVHRELDWWRVTPSDLGVVRSW
ncbi:DUF5819 family protein [Streptomyces caatingaensis]|uniref:Membrane protein n=1 Tax=Streptomyces caatingaensis TaxID=1678637 RepID=A0A0K9X7W8_9ACTN|nr:DUF5819 family protein [Streptomyces caatingaensis]KNB49161.1 membrane protein [Streptomyces caatingaensis]